MEKRRKEKGFLSLLFCNAGMAGLTAFYSAPLYIVVGTVGSKENIDRENNHPADPIMEVIHFSLRTVW